MTRFDLRFHSLRQYIGAPDSDSRATAEAIRRAVEQRRRCEPARHLGLWNAVAGAGLPLAISLDSTETLDGPDWREEQPSVIAETQAVLLAPAPGYAVDPSHWELSSADIYELWIEEIAFGSGSAALDRIATSRLPLLRAHRARIVGIFDVSLGPAMPSIVTLMAWPDWNLRRALIASPDPTTSASSQLPATLLRRRTTFLMQALPAGDD